MRCRRAPACCSVAQARSKAAATVSSTSFSTSVSGIASRAPATSRNAGTVGGSPARMASTMAQQRTLAASGPIESSEVDSGSAPSVGTRRCVGLKPVSPHSADGMRTEPPVSEPMPTTAMPSVTDTAAPLDEPPGMRPPSLRSHGFFGVP